MASMARATHLASRPPAVADPGARADRAGGAATLEVDALTMVYRGSGQEVRALENISLTVGDGEFVSIVGPSGCGKSTLLKLVAGLRLPTEGRIALHGQPVRGPRREVGIVFQSAVLLPWRTVLENVMLPVDVLHLPKREYRARALELLELVGLTGFENMYPNELSGGMQQRAAMARALIYDASVLLMDEPFGALDAMTREHMNLELQEIWGKSRKTVLFVTHSISEAVFLADRVVVMSRRPGRVLAVLENTMARPRGLDDMLRPEFGALVSEARRLLGSHREGPG